MVINIYLAYSQNIFETGHNKTKGKKRIKIN